MALNFEGIPDHAQRIESAMTVLPHDHPFTGCEIINFEDGVRVTTKDEFKLDVTEHFQDYCKRLPATRQVTFEWTDELKEKTDDND